MRVPPLRSLMRSNLLLVVAALVAGSVAAWLGARHLDARAATLDSEARQRFATSPYIVASRDVEKGQAIDASLLAIRSMPRAFAPDDALAPDQAGMLIGGQAAIAIRRGTPVVSAAVLPVTHHERLSARLPDGMRALTIQVDQLNSIAGHLEAGDSIDLLYSRTQGTGAVLVPLLQRVRVLAAGEVTDSSLPSLSGETQSGDFTSVTLLVSAADARRVVLAEQTGRLTLALRRASDAGTLDSSAFASAQLMEPAQSLRPARRSGLSPVELLVGGGAGLPARSWLIPGAGSATAQGEGA